jgi:hypothetical protein
MSNIFMFDQAQVARSYNSHIRHKCDILVFAKYTYLHIIIFIVSFMVMISRKHIINH